MARRERAKTRNEPRPAARRSRAFLWLVLAILAGLAATTNERTFGTITDEQQAFYTSVSIAEFGELGIGRGQLFAVHRREGDAVSVYGMGLSVLEIPLALLATPWERRFGGGSSQTLFVAFQILLVAGAAAGAGLLARRLGADTSGQRLAVLGTAFASPLWAYAATGYSEPLQALLYVFAILFSVRAVREGGHETRWAVAAGFYAGFAVLAKGVNLALGPFLLAPLLLDGDALAELRRRLRLVLLSAAGAAGPLAAWLFFEIHRFGKPFASYGAQGFTHSFFDGLWRLLVGVNKGLLVYFPLLLVCAWGAALLARDRETRGTAVAISSVLVLNLLVAARWWAWDGTMGWGPRLLVPAIPALAAAGAVAASRRLLARRLAIVLALTGVLVNALGAFQSESAALTYISLVPAEPIPPEEAAKYPRYFLEKGPGGEPRLRRCYTASEDAAFSPLRIHAFLLKSRVGAASAEDVKERLENAPWLSSHPDLAPDYAGAPAIFPYVRLLTDPFTWPHLGSATVATQSRRTAAFNPTYGNALSDQIMRAFDTKRPDRALRLSERLYALHPSGYTAALLAESLRATGRLDELRTFRDSLPELERVSPQLAIVLAFTLRSQGNEAAARDAMRGAARRMGSEALAKLAEGPLAAWPDGLRGVLDTVFAPHMVEQPGAGWVR